MVIVEVDQIPTKDKIVDVPITNLVEVYKTCQELQALCEAQHGIGISAVQAGIPWKLFIVKGDGSCPFIPLGEYAYFVNCEYEAITDEQVDSLEGCLSLRSEEGRLRSFRVKRYKTIRLYGLRLLCYKEFKLEAVDYTLEFNQEGIVAQHEVSHQLGPDGLISIMGKELFVW